MVELETMGGIKQIIIESVDNNGQETSRMGMYAKEREFGQRILEKEKIQLDVV